MKSLRKLLLTFSVTLGIISQMILLQASSTPNQSRIVPESISNISYEVHYEKYCKLIKYEIDLSNIINAALGTNKMMNFDLEKAIITLKTDSGVAVLIKGVQYNNDSNVLKVDLTDPIYNVEEGKKHIINIYLPTTFKSTVSYGDESASADPNTYIGAFIKINNKVKIDVKITATPRINEGRLEGSVEVKEEWGIEENKGKEVELTYKPMIRIL